jgi:hypothetical protein
VTANAQEEQMSVQLVGFDTAGASDAGRRPLAARTIAMIAGILRRIADEAVYMLREDSRHGRMSRDPKDWGALRAARTTPSDLLHRCGEAWRRAAESDEGVAPVSALRSGATEKSALSP